MKKFLKITAWVLSSLLLLLVVLIFYVRSVAAIEEPRVYLHGNLPRAVEEIDSGLFTVNKSWFRQSEKGLYELYVEGTSFQRGLEIGLLTKGLIQYQEEVFNEQIHRLVPSETYLEVLKYFVGWFNRDLDENVPEEYRQEIYGVSRAANERFNKIAPPYQRILNYHAAHDIGHALQNMSLVGCTAFATWADRSEDSTLIIGRNFDFYVGDDFAKNKIVAFYAPDKGHKFMMITFGGMTGVLSGMNEQGLTVTINAAKSEIPSASATPVSLVAREILQYASTIDEAYIIAKKRKMFVAEAFLIGSAKDKRAAIIEKTPDTTDLYESGKNYIIGTNHFQGKTLGQTELNREHVRSSASMYRYQRVEELLHRSGKNSVQKTAAILRNQKGKDDSSIGMGNEKLINQLIAHHGIIFQPEKKLVWISTAPWQLGEFVCYDLNKIFASGMLTNHEIHESALTIQSDTFLTSNAYKDILKFNRFRFPFQPHSEVDPDSLIQWNPESYLSYLLAGDIFMNRKNYGKARICYEQALKKEIATEHERTHIEDNLKKIKD
jgi:isopenicillin-N N-acyltransferase like protein